MDSFCFLGFPPKDWPIRKNTKFISSLASIVDVRDFFYLKYVIVGKLDVFENNMYRLISEEFQYVSKYVFLFFCHRRSQTIII